MNKKGRDKKGKFTKGHKGSGGRPKGGARSIVNPDAPPRTPAEVVQDMLTVYSRLGGDDLLIEWARKNDKNLTKFVEQLLKLAPAPSEPAEKPIQFIISDKFLPISRKEQEKKEGKTKEDEGVLEVKTRLEALKAQEKELERELEEEGGKE